MIIISRQDISDLIDDGFNNIGYWADTAVPVGDYRGEYLSDQIALDGAVKIHVIEEDKWYELNLGNFMIGLDKYVESHFQIDPKSDFEIDEDFMDEMDGIMTDEILQLALFGDVIYG